MALPTTNHLEAATKHLDRALELAVDGLGPTKGEITRDKIRTEALLSIAASLAEIAGQTKRD